MEFVANILSQNTSIAFMVKLNIVLFSFAPKNNVCSFLCCIDVNFCILLTSVRIDKFIFFNTGHYSGAVFKFRNVFKQFGRFRSGHEDIFNRRAGSNAR